MDLLSREEVASIAKHFGDLKVKEWNIENYSDQLIGYLGDHLRLTILVENNGVESTLNLFIKCMPRYDKWKAAYLKELNFFKKEYVMLSDLFKQFRNKGDSKWRPWLLFIKETVFVFEDVAVLGYKMQSHKYTLSYDQIKPTVATVAKFHAQSYIYEEKKSAELKRPYRIWEDYSQYLQEPPQGQNWRDTGRNAVIDYLKVYSLYRNKPNFAKRLEITIPMLYDGAMSLMKPSSVYRNTVVHRDLWTNNIFFKTQDNGKIHALIVDFQTVLYCSPMLDLSSLLFFNTNRSFRKKHTTELLDYYYEILSNELVSEGINIENILEQSILTQAYEESIMFAITQAAIILPITVMDVHKREALFENPDVAVQINTVSRSDEFIEIAKEDKNYCARVTELFEEIVERYIYPEKN